METMNQLDTKKNKTTHPWKKPLSGENRGIISRVAYLIGVPQWVFENELEAPQLEVFQELDQDKNARIIRNLCMVRTAMERFSGKISTIMHTEYKSIYAIPDFIPQNALTQLTEDGIRLSRQLRLVNHVIEINRIICDRINNCKTVFPDWVKWDYVRDIFIMKNGLTEGGVKKAGEIYSRNKEMYPYKTYLNWVPEDNGNILFHDRKFLTLLYKWHRDKFLDLAKVTTSGDVVMNNIESFIAKASKVDVVVDCENTDPYRLCAAIKQIEDRTKAKIRKILLFDDAHTMKTWRILESYTEIPIEYVMSHRVVQNKSLVDIEMTAITCKEHYRENVDSFIIVSSDSDFWGLISSLPEAHFLVMIERDKSSEDLKSALYNSEIFYCYIEDFYDGDSEGILTHAIISESKRVLEETIQLDMNVILEQALTATGIHMKPEDKVQFVEKNLSIIEIKIDAEGKISVNLNIKNAT